MTGPSLGQKIAIFRQQLERLRELPVADLDAFLADARTLDAALHRLQVAIRILIDLGAHAVAELGLGTPATSREILDKLEAAGHLPAGAAAKYGAIFAFRNRIVHLYDRVDPAIVHTIVRDDLGDLASLCDRTLAAIEAAGGT